MVFHRYRFPRLQRLNAIYADRPGWYLVVGFAVAGLGGYSTIVAFVTLGWRCRLRRNYIR